MDPFPGLRQAYAGLSWRHRWRNTSPGRSYQIQTSRKNYQRRQLGILSRSAGYNFQKYVFSLFNAGGVTVPAYAAAKHGVMGLVRPYCLTVDWLMLKAPTTPSDKSSFKRMEPEGH